MTTASIEKISVLLLAGSCLCASVMLACNPSQTPLARLQRASVSYYDGLRWKQFGQSAQRIPPLLRQRFIEEREEERERFFVVDYDVAQVELAPSEERARIIVKFTWYRLPSTTLEKTRMLQEWQSLDGTWMLLSQEE